MTSALFLSIPETLLSSTIPTISGKGYSPTNLRISSGYTGYLLLRLRDMPKIQLWSQVDTKYQGSYQN